MKAFLKRLKGVRRISMIQVEIYVFQAGEGDSFLVTIKDGKKEINLLIDCGNYVTYQKYIRKKLLNMAQNGKMIDYLILTHVHSDHIGGAIPLLKENGSSDAAKVIPIRNVLYNGFLGLKLQHYQEQACDDREKLIYQGICARRAAVLSKCLRGKRITLQEELCISKLLLDGRYNWNGGCGAWPEKVIINQSDQIEIGEHISIRFVSPGFNQLVAMNQEWEKYLERMNRRMDLKDNTLICSAYESFQYILNEKEYEEIAHMIEQPSPDKEGIEKLADSRINYDYTYENSSSIAFLLQVGEKRMLFLGDANIGVCQKILREWYGNGEMEMDFIKLSHHGSERNLSKNFLRWFGNKNYLISAGTGNKRPSKRTLALLFSEHPERSKKIFITNRNEHILWMDQEKIHQYYDFEFIDIAGQSIRI